MVSRLPPPTCLVSANPGEMAVGPCRYFGSSCGACGFKDFPAQGLPHHRLLQESDIGPCLHDEVAKDPCRYFATSQLASSTHSLENPCCPCRWHVLIDEDGFFIVRKRGVVHVTGQIKACS